MHRILAVNDRWTIEKMARQLFDQPSVVIFLMSVYGLLPIASLPCSGVRVDCTRISGLLPPHRFAVLGHDGLVARRLPIAFSCLLARGHFRVLPAPVRPVRHRAVG